MDIPEELLSKEFLSRFKGQEDAGQFMKDLHARVYERLSESEPDARSGCGKHSVSGHHGGNSRDGKYPKRLRTERGEREISISARPFGRL
jgi:hypothetical protein